MQKILAFLFNAARARFRRASAPHDDNLRANQFDDRASWSIYRVIIGG